jgi:hypothetical protein
MNSSKEEAAAHRASEEEATTRQSTEVLEAVCRMEDKAARRADDDEATRPAKEDEAAHGAKEDEAARQAARPADKDETARGAEEDEAARQAAVRALVKDSTLDDADPKDGTPSAANRAHLQTRQMKGLKRKPKFTRNLKALPSKNPDQKYSNFDYAAFRQEQASDNAQQVCAAIAPAKARSPLSKVKRDRTALRISLELSARGRTLLSVKCHRNQENIALLKRLNNQLMVDLLREKRASNTIIGDAMIEAHRLSAKALDMMTMAEKIQADAEVRIMNEQSRATTQLRQERAHSASASSQLRGKLATSIDKLNREQESSLKLLKLKSNKKYEKARNDVITLLSKLKDQRITWQKKLSDIGCSSKNLVSKERAHRRNTIQQQLDKTAAIESQLQNIIEGLELMNYEMVDKVKCAKRSERAAIKLYNKSKDAASRRLDKLLLEKEEKNQLKDELTRVLKAHDVQQKLLHEYMPMVEELRSTK